MKVSFYPAVVSSPTFEKSPKQYSLSRELLLKLIAQKKTNREMAKELGYSETYISIRMREEGVCGMNHSTKRFAKHEELILPLLNRGAGLKEIQEKTGLAINTIRGWIAKKFGKTIVAVKHDLMLGKSPEEIEQRVRVSTSPTAYAKQVAEEIRILLEQGYSKQEIAKIKGCSVASVFAYVKQFNLLMSRKEKTLLVSKQIIDRLLAGATKEEVAVELNVSRPRIDSAVRQYGLQEVIHKMVIERHSKK